MGTPVNFNSKLQLMTIKINYILINRNLSVKLISIAFPLYILPQQNFRKSAIQAQFAGEGL